MRLKSDARHWGTVAKTFHWLIALAIATSGTVGLLMVNMPRGPRVIPYFTFHKSLGITILTLAALRLLWRAFDRRPVDVPAPTWQTRLAHAVHACLYVLLFAVPLSGWLFDSATGLRPLYWFGLVHVPSLSGGPVPEIGDVTRDVHETLFWILLAIVALHVVGALKHHFLDRDETLARMWPGRSRRAERATTAAENAAPALQTVASEPPGSSLPGESP
jgi:cytochrome b561